MMKKDLETLRNEIDALDAQLLELLNTRAILARTVGEMKATKTEPFFTPEREAAVYKRLETLNQGPLDKNQIMAIYREIISAARSLEGPLIVSYLGPKGTFSNMAGLKRFGSSSEFKPVDTIQSVFEDVEHSNSHYGIIPVENSIAGVVPETLDRFSSSNVKICAEVYVPIAHHLVSHQTDLLKIKRVYSHHQPFDQCRKWLRAYLPTVECLSASSTADAAEKAKADPESAAITNALAAEQTGMPIIAEHIEDNAGNRTRFWVIGYNEPKPTGKDKTSIMFTLHNQPGKLYKALGAFYAVDVNMTMIESRPAQRSAFEYVFFTDVQGHHTEPKLITALKSLSEFVIDITILGSYPESDV